MPYQLPPELRSLHQSARRRRLQHRLERLQAERQASEPVRLTRGRYYSLSKMVGFLGISRDQLYRALKDLTTRKVEGYNGERQVKADDLLLAYCKRAFITIVLS